MNDDLSVEHPELEDFFDAFGGALPDPVRAHVASCTRCTRELQALVDLRTRARALPREITPAADLWPGIAERIARAGSPAGLEQPRPPAPAARVEGEIGRRIYPSWGWLAAAAVAAVVLVGGSLLSFRGRGVDAAPSTLATAPEQLPGRAPGLAAFASTEVEYRTTVEMLEAELAARRDQLDPATIEVVERNLAIIDRAIEESRRALAADPSSVDLPLLLSDIYRQKLELLEQAVRASART